MPIKSYRELEVWRRSMQLTEQVYLLVRQLPTDERFVLSSQVRRAAVSVPSNIAEGWSYGTPRRYVHHLRIALGSNAELQTQILLAARLQFIQPLETQPLLEQSDEIGKMLNGLIRSLDR